MKKTILMMTIVFSLCYSLQATPCVVGTLATYEGGACSVNGLTFSNFGYMNPAFGGAIAPPASGVDVTPITSGFGSEIGLLFTAPWLVSGGQAIDAAISFTVSCVPDCTDAELVTVGGANLGGSASVSEGSSAPPNLSLFSANSGSDSATFAPVGSFTVNKDIGVSGGTSGNAHMSFVYNLFSQSPTPPVPEPSLVLLCTGFLCLLPVARRTLRRAK
jgi:hypothetical protein